MKVLIVGFFARTFIPYIKKYEKVLNDNKIEFDIAYFDRDKTTKDIVHIGNEYIYSHKTEVNPIKKILPSIKYSIVLRNLIKENVYDKLIILTTMPGIILYDKLLKDYRKKYIYDYRDVTHERIELFCLMVKKMISNSYFTAVCSRGYTNIIGCSKKIVFNHNIINIENKKKLTSDIRDKEVINIGFLGYIRYFDVNKWVIDSFKNENKYLVSYTGKPFEDCDLEGYVKRNKIENVRLTGKYNDDDKEELYKNIDIINSIYDINSSEVAYAIPNRLYDAALYKKPIIVSKGTYLAKIVVEYNLGFEIEPFKDDLLSKTNEYIRKYEPDVFSSNCYIFLRSIQEDEKKFTYMINNFLNVAD